jgi:hypothetical protein
MRVNKNFLFSVILLFLSCFIFFLTVFLNQSLFLEKKEILTTLKVGEVAAFDLSNSTFSFGTITPTANSYRSIEIKNNYSFPIIAFFSSRGNISRFLVFEEKIKIPQNEGTIVNITTIFPAEKDYGEYSGKILITLKKSV